MKYFVLIIFLFSSQIYASQTNNNTSKKKEDNTDWLYYSDILQAQKELHLKSLLKTKKKIALRFWRFTPNISSLMELSKVTNTWIVKGYQFQTHTFQRPYLSKVSKYTPSTKKDLDSFLLKMKRMGLDTLTSQDNIKLEEVLVDGTFYYFEFAENNHYHSYYYSNPKFLASKYMQAQKVTAILKEFESTIEKE